MMIRQLVRVPKELFPKPRINCHEFVLPRVSLQDRTDILSVLANDILSWTSLDKQEEARILETSYPHEEVHLTLPYLPFILAFTYIVEPVALNSSPV